MNQKENPKSKEDRYQYGEQDLIGKGQYGTVYRAYDLKEERFVALKKISKKSRVIDQKELLQQELESLQKIHTPIGPEDDFNFLIKYYDYYQCQSYYNVAMELFDNSIELNSFLAKNGNKLTEKIALEIFCLICRVDNKFFIINQGIKALHSLDIVHRDIKPANVLIKRRPSLQIKIVDFGFAKVLDGLNQFYTQAGSPVFMSPQNLVGVGYDGKANDIWALGIMLFQMVTGGFPWKASSHSELNDQVIKFIKQQISLNMKDLSFNIKDIVVDCLQLVEKDRPEIDQLLWKVQAKLNQSQKLFDPILPKCSWVLLQKPKMQYPFLTLGQLEELAIKSNGNGELFNKSKSDKIEEEQYEPTMEKLRNIHNQAIQQLIQPEDLLDFEGDFNIKTKLMKIGHMILQISQTHLFEVTQTVNVNEDNYRTLKVYLNFVFGGNPVDLQRQKGALNFFQGLYDHHFRELNVQDKSLGISDIKFLQTQLDRYKVSLSFHNICYRTKQIRNFKTSMTFCSSQLLSQQIRNCCQQLVPLMHRQARQSLRRCLKTSSDK